MTDGTESELDYAADDFDDNGDQHDVSSRPYIPQERRSSIAEFLFSHLRAATMSANSSPTPVPADARTSNDDGAPEGTEVIRPPCCTCGVGAGTKTKPPHRICEQHC